MRISLEIERMSGGLLPSRVEVQESDAFHHVRQQIAAICGVPLEDQRLIFAGGSHRRVTRGLPIKGLRISFYFCTGKEITTDNATVEELGLQTGSKIRMVVKGGTAVFVAPRSSGHARVSSAPCSYCQREIGWHAVAPLQDSFEDLVKAVPCQPKRALAHDGSERLSALTQVFR